MKYFGRPVLIFFVMLILAVPVFAIDFKTLKASVDIFAEDMADSLPFYSTIGLNWSDAYIGNFPSFGIGLSAGLTIMDNRSINHIMGIFSMPNVKDLAIVSKTGFPLPGYAVDGRIGLPVIPVDIGVKFGYLPTSLLESLFDIEIKNLLIGADVRYVIVNSKVLPMRLSVGLGFNYLSGGISFSDSSLKFDDNANGIVLTGADPKVDIMWKTTSIEFKIQASFPYKILTPYAGAGISYAWSKAGYKVTGLSISSDYKTRLEDFGINASDESFDTIIGKSGMNTRVFGGVSFNLIYVRFDLTGMFEILSRNFGATFGLRFQM